MGPATNEDDEGKFEIGDQDDFLFFDGKNHAHETAFKDAYVHPEDGAVTRSFGNVYLMYDEESFMNNLVKKMPQRGVQGANRVSGDCDEEHA